MKREKKIPGSDFSDFIVRSPWGLHEAALFQLTSLIKQPVNSPNGKIRIQLVYLFFTTHSISVQYSRLSPVCARTTGWLIRADAARAVIGSVVINLVAARYL